MARLCPHLIGVVWETFRATGWESGEATCGSGLGYSKFGPEPSGATDGRLNGEAPFSGSLTHRGWRVEEVKLPQLVKTHDARIIAPAEVEL